MLGLIISYFVIDQKAGVENLEVEKNTDWILMNTSFWQKGVPSKDLSVIVVTLEKRLAQIKTKLTPSGLTKRAFFMKAQVGKTLDLNLMQKYQIINPSLITHLKNRSVANIIGCTISHVSAISYFVTNPDLGPYCLIMEDDLATPSKDCMTEIQMKLKSIDEKFPDWEMFYLGYKYEPTHLKRNEAVQKHKEGDIWKLHAPLAAHSYILKRATAEKLIRLLLPLTKVIDELYYDLISAGEIKAYGVRDLMFIQDTKNVGSELGSAGIQDQFIYKM